MNDKKLISKIKKLMALSKSSNEHEAALALARAQKLMQENALVDTDVTVTTYESTGAPSNAAKPPNYMSQLANVVAHAFGCDFIYIYKLTNSFNQKCVIRFVGIAERPEIAAYSFDVLRRQLTAARQNFMKKNKRIVRRNRIIRADVFCDGWVYGISEKLAHFDTPKNERSLIRGFIKSKDYSAATIRDTKNCRGAEDASHAGYRAGLNAELNQGVAGESMKQLGVNHD